MLGMGIGSFPAIASHRVTLVSGSHLEATSYRMAGSLIVFSLPGGGEVGIPPRNVLQIVEQPTPAEEASPEAAVPVPRAQESSPAAATALPHVSPWDPEPGVRALIQEIAGAQSVDPRLVEAMVKVESNFDPYAVSRKGAMGLMQLMPKTARRFQVGNTFDPVQNLVGGTRYIRELLDRYGEIRLALAAYNAGEEAVDRYRGVPPFRETRDYVVRILHLLNP
jgi:soluble lytic murein transglycosylase-like protein